MNDRDLRQTVDLVAANIQEILEILPTLATKEEMVAISRRSSSRWIQIFPQSRHKLGPSQILLLT